MTEEQARVVESRLEAALVGVRIARLTCSGLMLPKLRVEEQALRAVLDQLRESRASP